MHTEDEARTLWCSEARVAHTKDDDDFNPVSAVAINRVYGIIFPEECVCIASECAKWRWVGGGNEKTITNKKEPPYGDGWVLVMGQPHLNKYFWERSLKDQRGYCGLAGMP